MSQEKPNKESDYTLVALGSNATSLAGGPQETVLAAIFTLREYFDDVQASRVFQTPAFPAGSGPDFANSACSFRSDLSASKILDVLHQVEAEFGRERLQRWGQRSLDLDLIACGQAILPDRAEFEHWRALPIEAQKTDAPKQLILPHPRLQDRPFVLVPLADVAPDWRHPVLGQTVIEMLASYDQAALDEIRPIS